MKDFPKNCERKENFYSKKDSSEINVMKFIQPDYIVPCMWASSVNCVEFSEKGRVWPSWYSLWLKYTNILI